ncbi:MAG TPA: ABC transporter permease [Acidimicrobiales bacterium]|nr:ABC transporter permease [Acidimicrobiales bacterium]
MARLIARRLSSLVPVLFLVSLVVYGLMALVPGDAAVQLAGGVDATEERIAEVRTELGLDDPFLVQYGRWLKGAVTFDFGESLVNGQSVSGDILNRLPVTASIAFGAMVVGLLVGVPAGIVAGMKAGTRLDRGLIFGTTLGIAVPNFWLAMMLILVFAVNLGWFPAIGFTRLTESPWDWLRSLVLPSLALGTFVAASVARQLRGELADVMQRSYVRTAWAKGGSARLVVGKHALKNAAIPAVTVIGLQMGGLIGGTVILEQIFSIPGLGTYLLQAITSSDMPVIMGVTTMFVLVYMVMSLLVDVAYGLLNPKVRVS